MAKRSSSRRGGGASGRELTVRVKTARGRRSSSTRWLQRQLNDPYVQAAKRDGYRSRAAYKLIELNDRFRVLKPGMTVVDLGAAPGGWAQVSAAAVGARGRVVAVDITPFDQVAGVELIIADVTELASEALIRDAAGGGADIVLSDMAPPSSGHRGTDHLRIIGLAEAGLDLARGLLRPGGSFVAKVWQGGTENELLTTLKRDFSNVRHAKPPASRSDSAEMYVVAQGFRAVAEEQIEKDKDE
jgi:23S rRNA (uridine2552-2'-O)-methyltransferase